MRKSIFRKFFSITACIVTISFALFGAFMIYNIQDEWIVEKHRLLSKNAAAVAQSSADALAAGTPYAERMEPLVRALGDIIDAEIFVVDSQGGFVICSHEDYNCIHRDMQLSDGTVSAALAGDTTVRGRLDGLYQRPCYIVSTPIKYNGEAIGAVFAAVPMTGSYQFTTDMLRILIIGALAALLIVFIAIYLSAAKLTKPLRQMAYAASRMEKGEFFENIPVSSRDEVGMLAEAFNKMSKSLGALEKMRRSFISSVSHELKTPMTTISGFVDGILDGTIKPEETEKYLTIVSAETKRLSRLVNSMLQLSRLESEEVKLKPVQFNVSDMVIQIMLSFEQQIEKKSIEIRGLDEIEPIMLTADRDLIHQVIYNLVENAIKFTPDNGYIAVSIAKHGSVKIHIENSGEGLDKSEMARIFERFYKTDRSRSSDKTGVGFGLYIVKTIVDLHNGKITVGSVKNEYTAFDLVLPDTQLTAQISERG